MNTIGTRAKKNIPINYLSHVTCHAYALPFSSVQFYDILQILVMIYFVFFQ